MSFVAGQLDFCDDLTQLIQEQKAWSEKTFGTKEQRGPVGPLKHLAKEALEAAEKPEDIKELADCLILVLDALWRSGHGKIHVLVKAGIAKIEENKKRTWPTNIPPDQPIEHVRGVVNDPDLVTSRE